MVEKFEKTFDRKVTQKQIIRGPLVDVIVW
jgi:hypothetical protein